MFVINWILLIEAGTTGVAAFTIVNYILWLSITVVYGNAEALGPLISVNFGAGKAERIIRFMHLVIAMSVTVGVVFAVALVFCPETLASVFINENETDTLTMTVAIIAVIWPTFLFNGINITISGYFTGMHCAAQSAAIALCRSLVLPVILIFIFWQAFGMYAAFMALPTAEVLTFALSAVLFYRATPVTLVTRDRWALGSARQHDIHVN